MGIVLIRIFITLFLAVFVTTMGAGMVAPLLPVYAHELGAGALQIGLIFGAFSLTRSVFVPYFGKLSDRKGKKPLLTIGLFLYFLLSLLYAVSNGVWPLVLLRLGQGFASAMILPVAQAYVGMITPEQREGRLMGIFNMSIYGGLSAGPVLGGLVKDWFNIEISFLSMGALTLFGFILCLVSLPAEDLFLKNKNNINHRSMSVSYIKMLKSPQVFSLFMFRACFTTCIGIIWTFLPLLAGTQLGLSGSAIGFLVMIHVLVAGLLQAPMGYIADQMNKRVLVIGGGILGVVAVLSLIKASSFMEIVLVSGLLGLAGGISFPAVMAIGVIQGRQNDAMGSMMGLLAMAHSVGMLIGPILAGMLMDLFSLKATFFLGAGILSSGIIVFFMNHHDACQERIPVS
jgi:MFS family permease